MNDRPDHSRVRPFMQTARGSALCSKDQRCTP